MVFGFVMPRLVERLKLLGIVKGEVWYDGLTARAIQAQLRAEA
jgi:hypothetical protein